MADIEVPMCRNTITTLFNKAYRLYAHICHMPADVWRQRFVIVLKCTIKIHVKERILYNEMINHN